MTGLVSQVQRARSGGPDEPVQANRRAALLGLVVVLLLAGVAVVTGNVVYVLGFLVFLVGLLVSVVLHEGGHFVMARRFGMKATQFFVGFGPTLWSRQRGETEYGVKAIPAGGFVKIVGMTPLEEVEPEDQPRAFYKAPTRQRVVVLAAGSTMHFLIALVLVFGTVFALGTPQEQPPEIGVVAECIASDPGVGEPDVPADEVCGRPDAVPAPALLAGVQVGDRPVAVDGRPVGSLTEVTTALRAVQDREVVLEVLRDGQRVALAVTPRAVSRIVPEDPEQRVQAGTIGVTQRLVLETERPDSVGEGFGDGVDVMTQFATRIAETFTERLGSVTQLYSDDRDPNGFIGIVGAGRISGEVLESEETLGVKAFSMILLVASLNLFVGIFNLLPLLPLDGGHIAVAVYEGARDRVRRLRGYRGEVQHVDYTRLLPLTYAVAGFFALFTLVLLGADLVNPISIS